MKLKIISGGQTGVDRAALDAAIELNIPHGGWCPKGRLAEDGRIDARYALDETESADYSERTKLNIRDADATLIILPEQIDKISDGTILTINEVKEKQKLFLLDNIIEADLENKILCWLNRYGFTTVNIAGPRESQSPNIYRETYNLLVKVLYELKYQNQCNSKSLKAHSFSP